MVQLVPSKFAIPLLIWYCERQLFCSERWLGAVVASAVAYSIKQGIFFTCAVGLPTLSGIQDQASKITSSNSEEQEEDLKDSVFDHMEHRLKKLLVGIQLKIRDLCRKSLGQKLIEGTVPTNFREPGLLYALDSCGSSLSNR